METVFPPLIAQLFGQTFDWPDLAIIGLLVLLEGVLSIDNALVLGLLAKRLPKHQRAKALSYGIIGAFVFRALAVILAAYLLQWVFVKFIGGAYLVYIAVKHLFFEAEEHNGDKIVVDETGHPVIVDEKTGGPISKEREDIELEERLPFPRPKDKPVETRESWWRFWKTVGVIELTDVAFAVDSILAAIALAGGRSEKLWVIYAGGILGMVLMRFAAAIFIRLLDKFPRFELSAYMLVIIIGLKLLVDWGFNSDWSFDKQPWIGNRLGGWKQSFENLEANRRELVKSYDRWLDENWIFDVQHEHPVHKPAEDHGTHEGEIAAPEHVPHLLDFHDLRFPECMTFWLVMIGCFAYGFWPVKKQE